MFEWRQESTCNNSDCLVAPEPPYPHLQPTKPILKLTHDLTNRIQTYVLTCLCVQRAVMTTQSEDEFPFKYVFFK